MAEIILFIISILPVILIGRYLYQKDKEKEPPKLLTKLFLGGIGSCILVLIVSAILGAIFPIFSATESSLNLIELAIHVFIGIALVEESCKWVMVYFLSYNDKEFDEFYDMILYAAFVSLGFAAFENLFYVYSSGISVGVLRALLAVPGHVCDAIYMGYYLGLAKKYSLSGDKKAKEKNIALSILVPTIIHGVYDYCLLSGETLLVILVLVGVVFLYIYSIKKVKEVSTIDRKLKYKDSFCPNCGSKVEFNFCPNCGRKNE